MRRTSQQGIRNKDQAGCPTGECVRRRCNNAGSGDSFLKTCAGLLLLLSGLSPTLYAESPAPDVHAVARLVDSHYNKLHSLRARFTESYQGLGMVRNESGTLLLLKPGRMRWDYTSPAGKVFLIDGKFAWFYAQGSAQVQRIPARQLDDLRSPLRFLLGHTQLEKELTGLHLSTAANGKYVLTGEPPGQENRVRRVTLTIAPKTGSIVGIEIEETDGAITGFTFSDEETNAAIPESTFHFTPPAGIPVVDGPPPV